MNKVLRKISSTINRETMTTFADADFDGVIIVERLAVIGKAMKLAVSEDDAWALALACVKMWMPNPSRSGEFAYNTPAYNAVEIFCLCVLKAHKEN